ncbi:hypothetical protein HLH26_11345 [Gluconacetobacter sp. 1b LMG 1731]|uniref:Uncharacterized protein n=1 Tax=Gluconacetobacter dulcium TaxID=2729096 RepID=A0A7W4NSZ2_9PROT|nr:hypothetical protein [Gluconacetobacter dulcium]MBB2165119.1 hypothetical protein [Gluconacetobacter dulcium]MBB2194255.1 hypothetical protein [Gluconacetobacter dulcium]
MATGRFAGGAANLPAAEAHKASGVSVSAGAGVARDMAACHARYFWQRHIAGAMNPAGSAGGHRADGGFPWRDLPNTGL